MLLVDYIDLLVRLLHAHGIYVNHEERYGLRKRFAAGAVPACVPLAPRFRHRAVAAPS
ncbi:hypothetical protein GCM10009020_12100 [Natronoarchaeum mannanilyticum]|uniref:Uncharacterized protein n=1 Tax=Natronoarchaeum mannanilyticum TaxID=926360 RepID=A0AAV3T9W0_9EURY